VVNGTQRIAELAAEAASARTPVDALRKASELRRELDAFERRQVARALAEGASFAEIAREIGLSRQAVHRRFRELAADEGARITAPEVRRILRLARDEARALGADAAGSEHVLLATLRTPDLPAAALLRTAGASFQRARAYVQADAARTLRFRRGSEEGEPPALLAAPAHEARRRGGKRIEVEDLVLGALGDNAGGAARTLLALGVDLATVRAELRTLSRSRMRFES
jgi:ATP-dependent Clp protease ATP-binding subunit ClpA